MLDSSFCIDVKRDRTPALRKRFKAETGTMAISSIVFHELIYGAAISELPARARRKVLEFVARFDLLDFDRDAADHAGQIRADLRRAGQMIGHTRY